MKSRAGALRLPAFMRACGMDKKHDLGRVVPAINIEAWRSLGKSLGLLNQAMAALNSGRASGGLALKIAVDDMQKKIGSIRPTLIGLDGDEDREAS